MKIEEALEVLREMLDEKRMSKDALLCNQLHYCKAFRKDEVRTSKCPFGTCEVCERVVAFDTIADFAHKARGAK